MPATTPISVLFVEDSPHDAELALVTLERSGYGIDSEVVFDQAGVVEALQRRSFDLILSDFILPGYSGSLALQDARLLAPETPKAAVSLGDVEERSAVAQGGNLRSAEDFHTRSSSSRFFVSRFFVSRFCPCSCHVFGPDSVTFFGHDSVTVLVTVLSWRF